MGKNKTFLMMKLVLMVGSLAGILYVMNYLRSGAAFTDPRSPAAVLLGTQPEAQEKTIPASVVKPSEKKSSDSQGTENH